MIYDIYIYIINMYIYTCIYHYVSLCIIILYNYIIVIDVVDRLWQFDSVDKVKFILVPALYPINIRSHLLQ